MRGLSQREMTLAIVLLLAVAGAGWWKLNYSDDSPASAPVAVDPVTGAPVAPSDIPPLQLERDSQAESINDKMRNLFGYTKSPADFAAERAEAARVEQLRIEAQKRREREQQEAGARAAAAQEYARLHPSPPPAEPAPAMNLRFIGYMGDPKNKIVVFSDGTPNGDLFLARKGEVVRENFVLLDVDFETVTLGYVNPKWNDRRTLRMGS